MKKILMLLLLLLPLAMASCGDDKDEPTTNTTKDPDGTIIVNVELYYYTPAAGCEIGLGDAYNLYCKNRDNSAVSIVGPVKGIGNINLTAAQTQSMTWTRYAAAQVGYGYIFKVDRGYKNENGQQVYYYDYYAVYVVSEIGSTNGGVMGYTLKVRKLLDNVPWQN